MRPRITQVEFHVTHACNFTCESCSHFSQDGHAGRATVESFVREVGPWAPRLQPRFLLMLGGEPTLNPDLCDLLVEARRLWPERGVPGVRILLVTNGWFLFRHPRLPQVLREQDVRLDISRHSDDPVHVEKLMGIVARVRGEWGIEPTFRPSLGEWTHIYKGSGKDTMPFEDGDPERSWRACVSKECMQFHEGRLWKCPPVAYLPMQHRKFGLDERAWAPFLAYRPLAPTCTDAELAEFVGRRCEAVCGQCPAHPVAFRKPQPARDV